MTVCEFEKRLETILCVEDAYLKLQKYAESLRDALAKDVGAIRPENGWWWEYDGKDYKSSRDVMLVAKRKLKEASK